MRFETHIIIACWLASICPAQAEVQRWTIRNGTRPAWVLGCAYDPITDTLWVASGDLLETYGRDHVRRNAFRAPSIPAVSKRKSAAPVGLTIDTATGNAWIVDWGGPVYEISAEGELQRSWRLPKELANPTSIAHDAARGLLWVCDDATHTLTGFDRAGKRKQQVNLKALGRGSGITGLAVDATTGSFFVTRDLARSVVEIAPDGTVLASVDIGRLLGEDQPTCIALDTRAGTVFVGGLGKVMEVSRLVTPCVRRPVRYGSACVDADGRMPRLDVTDCPTAGATLGIGTVSARRPGAVSLFLLGRRRASVSLAGLGAPGCFLFAEPIGILGATPVHSGRALLRLRLPNHANVRGRTTYVHCLIAGPSGLVSPNALELVVR